MLRLKRHNEAPPSGFQLHDRKTGFKAHGWSLNSVGAQWYQEQLRRGIKTTLERSKADVETYTCNELMKLDQWDQFVEVVSEWSAEDYAPFDNYDRETTSPHSQSLFAVVFPFCAKDGQLALKLMKWIGDITPQNDHLLVLSYDTQTPPQIVQDVQTTAKATFRSIKSHSYPSPPAGTWPPTWAFKSAARYMERVGIPWLWFEPDAVPLKPEWLDVLQDEYTKSGKAFAGPIVRDMGHCNGTALYPANTPKRIPRALDLMRTAWDVTMKGEMIHDCHDLSRVFYHAWTIVNGEFHPFSGGSPPEFPPGKIDNIPKEAVVFHRCKGGSLIDRLRERRLVVA